MIAFRSADDLEKLSPSDPAYPLVRRLVLRLPEVLPKYDPDADGWVVLVQPGDSAADLPELGRSSFADVPWEGVTREGGFYHAVWLANNQFGLEVVVPDADWLPREFRESLEENLT